MKRIILATAAAALMATPALAQKIGGPPPYGTAQVNEQGVGDDIDPRYGSPRGQTYGFPGTPAYPMARGQAYGSVATPGIQAGPYAYSYEYDMLALDPDPNIRLQQHREQLLNHDRS